MRAFWVFPLAVLSFGIQPGVAQTFLELQGARPNLDAQAQVVEQGVGTEVDFTEDLGIRDATLPTLRLTHIGKRGFVSVAYEKASYSGDRLVQRTIEYGGTTWWARGCKAPWQWSEGRCSSPGSF